MGLRRVRPLKNGAYNGTAVARYYWADFLNQHRRDIRGRALEVGETATIREYGGSAVEVAEAIDLTKHSPEVTIAADLSRADHVPSDQFDCFVNQFTTCSLYDIEAGLHHSIRILKPGGVLLINFWCVDYYFFRGIDMGSGGAYYMHHWFTPIGVHDLLHKAGLKEQDYSLQIYGNLLTRFAFIMNMPSEEMTKKELTHQDPAHPLLICARVVKPHGWSAPCPPYRDPSWLPKEPAHVVHPVKGHQGVHYG